MNPKISIIVPVYNVEKYVTRCIKSILSQTLDDFELILVDDGSTDRSGIICDEFAEKDNRIKVIHKNNGGASSARNRGIDVATGCFLGFVDSDDWILANMYEKLITLAEKENAQIAECRIKTMYSYKTEIKKPLEEIQICNGVECQTHLFNGSSFFTILVFNKVYRRELFNNLRFPMGMICEDQYLTPRLYMRCEKVVASNEIGYLYNVSENSITRSAYGIKKLDGLRAFEETRGFYEENNYKYLVQWCDTIYSFLLINHYNNVIEKLHDKDISKRIIKKYRKLFLSFLTNPHILFKQKIILLVYYFFPRLYPIEGKIKK